MNTKTPAVIKVPIVPPPTKREILLATATAIAQERHARNKARHERREAARAAFNSAYRKEALKLIKSAEFDALKCWRGEWAGRFDVKIKPVDFPVLAALEKQLATADDDRDETTAFHLIVKELRERFDTSDRINAMLADPETKAALLKAGNRALSTVTNTDRTNATNV